MERSTADQLGTAPGGGPGGDGATDSLTRKTLHFTPVREASGIEHLQLRTLYTHWRRAALREGRSLPSRQLVKDRELTRHFPFLLLSELVRTDGHYRLLGAGKEARRFWALEPGMPADEARSRAELLRSLMRHLSANRMAVTLTGAAVIGGVLNSFHLLALPMAEKGRDMDAVAIEVAFSPVPSHMVEQYLARVI